MKKIILVLMFVLACLCFVGCPTPNTPNTPSQNTGSNQNQNQNQNQGSNQNQNQNQNQGSNDNENSATTEATRALLDEAVDLLMEGDIDGGIAKISKAYDGQKNDETKMYYALAELASISVDESVSTLLTENFGMKNYPSTMNALLSGEWLKEYKVTENLELVGVFEYEYGSYVRVSGDEVVHGEIEARAQYYDGQWVDRDLRLSNVYLDENGLYLVNKLHLQYILSDEELEELDVATIYDCYDPEKSVEVTTGSVLLPEFEPVEGLNSVTTVEQLAMQIIVNLFDCNPDGLNDLIDNILAIFGEKFENAKALAASMSNASVALPEELFDALELEELLEKSSLKVGKAELNVLVASMEILQGTFQWISSYDWSVNIASIKDELSEESEDPDLDFFRKLVNEKTLTVRNAKAMEASKESFIDAIDMVVASYDYLVGDTSEYPEAAIEEIKEYGDAIKAEALKVKTAIKNGEVYELEYEENDNSVKISIDLGKFFQAGYFSDLIEKDDNGGLQLYVDAYAYYYDENYDRVSIDEYVELPLTATLADAEEIGNDLLEEFMNENNITEDELDDSSVSICFKLNGTILDDVLPGLIPAEYIDESYIPLFSF